MEVLLVFLQILLVFANGVLTSDCPHGWKGNNNSCYLLVLPTKTWEDARANCVGYGGDLVIMTSAVAGNFVNELTKNDGRDALWIGLYRNDTTGVATQGWVWVNGSKLEYARWQSGEPNNYKNNNERCGEVFRGRWNDNKCGSRKSSICERKKGIPDPTLPVSLHKSYKTTVICEIGWTGFRQSCYKLIHLLATWYRAKSACTALGGHLFKIDDPVEQNYFSSQLKLSHTNYWIGLNDLNEKGKWVWESGKSRVNFTNWQDNEPNNLGVQQCVEIFGGYQSGFWNDESCNSMKYYICEKEEGKDLCPDTWIPFEDDCYQFNVGQTQRKTWTAAKSACKSVGDFSSLAIITTQEQQDFIVRQISSTVRAEFWIGLNDIEVEKVFKWSDDIPLRSSDYTNWLQEKVQMGNAPWKDCVSLLGQSDGAWVVNRCNQRSRFICQRKRAIFRCNGPLGMENGNIEDDQITASSYLKTSTRPEKARLRNNGSWCPLGDKKTNEYLQIDLGSTYRIRQIAVQGLATSYCIKYGINGRGYQYYNKSGETCEILNSESSEKAHFIGHDLQPFIARYVRIFPRGNNVCLRVELFGCLSASTIDHGVRRPNWQSVRGFTRITYQINYKSLSWTDARSYCLDRNADLLSITNYQVHNFFSNLLGRGRTRNSAFWIGLSDRDYINNFYWSDGSPMSFLAWRAGYPNRYFSGDSCVQLQAIGRNANWRHTSCSTLHPFICMKKEPSEFPSGRSSVETGVTGVWMSSATYYWPLSIVDGGKIWGTTTGTAYGIIKSTSGVKNRTDAALQFLGSGSYIDAGFFDGKCLSSPDICSRSGLTISFMASFDSVAVNWQKRTNILDSLGNEKNSTGVAVYLENKKLWFVVSTMSSYWIISIDGIQGDRVWRHYAMSWSRILIVVYRNGQSVSSRAYMPNYKKLQASKDLKTIFHIGIPPNSNAKAGEVNLAMLAVWERAISTDAIAAIYITEFGWCPSAWMEFGMSCYQFNMEKKNWQNSRIQCQSSGSDLVTITSPVEQGFMTQNLYRSSWIGLNEHLPSRYRWSSSLVAPTYTNWASGMTYNSWRTTTCARTTDNGFGTWNDVSCRNLASFACEKGKDTNEPVHNKSDVGTLKFKRVCQFSKSKLICPHGTVIRVYYAFWGRKSRNVCRYISITDCGLKEISNTTKKIKTQCDGKINCILYASNDGKYLGDPCGGVYKYLEVNYTCVRRDPKLKGSCPSGWKLSNDGNECYGLILSKKTWHDAENACRKFNANLLSINGRFMQSMATSLMERAWDTNVWIGLNDLQNQGVYQWSDGTQVAWTNWYVGQPDERRTGKSCVYMNLTRSKKDWMFWRNGNCSLEAVFMCKKILSQRSTPTPAAKEMYKCPSSWDSYGMNCYKLYNIKLDWRSSRRYCINRLRNGNLASIMSLEENDFISNLSNQSIWIGLESKGVFRGHAWSDKNPVAYTNWDVGQPDSYNGREDCTELDVDTGYWDDSNCNYRRPFVCKKLKPSVTTSVIPSITTPTFGPSSLCKSGWIIFDNMCYYIGIRTLKTWHEAELTCRIIGGHLTSVNSEAERIFLVKAVSRLSRYSYRYRYYIYSYWIGLNDLGPESNYKWTDRSGYGRYIYWSSGEPNDNHGQEDCVAMLRSSGKWNDNHCSSKKYFICKANNEDATKVATIGPATKVGADGYCDPGWLVNGQWCYEFHTDPTDYKTWKDAKVTCEKGYNSSHDGELASIADKIEQAFITMNIKEANVPLWIGLNNFHDRTSYMWTDNSPANYYHWKSANPIPYRRYPMYRCVEMSPFRGNVGRWNTASCNNMNGYICKTAASNSPIPTKTASSPTPTAPSINCPDGYLIYQQSCYKFFKTEKTFGNARKACSVDEAELMTINSEYEEAYIIYLLERNVGSVWIGLSHEPWSSFTYTDHSPSYYSNWGVGEPNRLPDQRSCVQVNMTGKELGRWEDVDCDNKNSFVCHIYYGEPRITLAEDSICEAGWTKYQKFCYKYFDVSKSWAAARYTCQNEGGHLLSISDDREQDFTLYNLPNIGEYDLWLGLNDRNEEQGYQWSDGSAVTFINWGNGAPSLTPSKNCVIMNSRDGKWSDHFCSNYRRFICKRSLECSSTLPLKPYMVSVSGSSDPHLGPDKAIIDSNIIDSNNRTWCVNASSAKPRIQIDLGRLVKISKIIIQGRLHPYPQYVRAFYVQYSRDGSSWSTYLLQGIRKVFFANIDGENQITKNLDIPIKASSIAIIPLTWKGEQICMRVGLNGCGYVCQGNLGMQFGRIADVSIVAKSANYPTYEPRQARPLGNGWCAKTNDEKQWIQVDLKSVHLVTKIMTFGDRKDSYVKSYKIQFSSDGSDWISYKQRGVVRIFKGNVHAVHPMTHTLSNVVQASYIRIVPLSWKNNICMRFELFGCIADCDGPMIQKDKDVKLSSSDPNSNPEDARLNSGKAWCTKSEKGQYLEVDFAKRIRLQKITTQGSPLSYGEPRRVVTFTISYLKNKRWKQYIVEEMVKNIVSGNLNDSRSPSTYHFINNENGLLVRKVRIYPEMFTKSGICMRVEFYGCLAGKEIIPTQPPTSQTLLHVSLRFTSLKWSSELANPSSEDFKATSNIISNSIQSIYENNIDSGEGKALREVQVKNMRKGSVIADMIFVFNPKFAENENITKPLMDAVSSGNIGNLKVDKNSLVIKENNDSPVAGNREREKLSAGAVVGLVFGVLLALILAVGVGFYCVKRRRKEHVPRQFNNPILYTSAHADEFEDE